MRRSIFIFTLALAVVQALGRTSGAAGEKSEVVTLNTRPSVTVDFLLIEPDMPVASVILFEGGAGDIRLSGTKVGSKGFLAASREKFAADGFVVALVDAPSDKKGHGGMPGGFRSSAAHVKDIDSVIAWLRRAYTVPVWLIGVSRGTQSAAYAAIHGNASINGLVLASSMTKVTDKSIPIPSMNLTAIAVPTLLVAHERDGCKFTPPKGAEEIKRHLKNAATVEVHYFEGGHDPGKDPCRVPSYHTFNGIEDVVVAAIASFIKTNTTALKTP